MAEKRQLIVYAAAYETVERALADLDAIERLHKTGMIGQFDAAVIDKEDGRPHVLERMDSPHLRVIPEWFGGGTLPRGNSTRRLSTSKLTMPGSSRLASPPSKQE